MDEIKFVDTTLRDGHQSLWAEKMTTGMMLPVVERIDDAGFIGIELLSPSHILKAVRELGEDPFERIRLVAERASKTPLRVNAGGLNVFGLDQWAMVDLYWRVMAAAGIKEARISDSWNDPKIWQQRAGSASKAGILPIINITYSISPRHSNDYYVERTKAAVRLKPFRLCLKDPGGLLTPERTRELVPLMLKHAGDVPIEFHTHCSTGLGPLCCLEAVEQGLRIINTAIPPLVDDASLPSIFDVAENLRTLGYRTAIDEESLRPVVKHFTTIARREGLPIGMPVAYNSAQYVHQVPGGMISNLRHQLREVGAESKLPEVLEETVRVRAEFGYPIMVTPLSQFVGSQAAVNVMSGERYKQVTDQTIRYALGHFGGDIDQVMDPDVRAKIVNRPRAGELAANQIRQMSPDELRQDLDAAGLSDEDFLLRYLMRKEDIDKMRASAGPVKEYMTDSEPLAMLVSDLSKLAGTNSIRINKPGFSLTLGKVL